MKQQPKTEFNNSLDNKLFTSRLNIISGRWYSWFHKSPNFIKLFFILLLLLVMPITSNISQQAMRIKLKAAAFSSLVFNPQTITLVSGGENKDVSLLFNSGDNEVSFVHVEIGFDKDKIQLS